MSALEELRLQLLANGYTPIRNRDKRTFMPGWPGALIDEGIVKGWTRRHRRDTATGIRVEGGLAVIDIDIDDEAAMTLIANRIMDIAPALAEETIPLLVRRGKGAKEAWFVRTDTLFSRLHSRAWCKPGESEDDGSHRMEIFGGASPRQFGAFGPHTLSDDGEVLVEYSWSGRSPADAPKSNLPMVTKAQLTAIVDATETILDGLGWNVVARSSKGESETQRVYDLLEDMTLDLMTGGSATVSELRAHLSGEEGEHMRCSASFWEGAQAKNRTRCLIHKTKSGALSVWDSATGITHFDKAHEPRDHSGDIEKVAAKLRELETKERNRVTPHDGAFVAAAKMQETLAYCENYDRQIVPIHAKKTGGGVTSKVKREFMLPNCDKEIGPRGGEKLINPVDLWLKSPKRVNVSGMQMRPDMNMPLFMDEEGERWVNTYWPPLHDATGGDAQAGVDFIAYLVPDAGERLWFTQWLAHKVRHPHIPGPAVVMVARNFGTGRGTLGEICAKLIGRDYYTALSYDKITGGSTQAVYNAWGMNSLMVFVSESSNDDDGSSYKAKQRAYDVLKENVEVRAVMRTYDDKYEKMMKAMHMTTFLIATNHADALPIPPDDRRFGILTNPDQPMDRAGWEAINAWMENPANIAAFFGWLEAVDLSSYSPYAAPIMTRGKRGMTEMGMSDIDVGLNRALDAIKNEVFTVAQVTRRMRAEQQEYDMHYPAHWEGTVKRILHRKLHRVGVPKGANWQPLIEGTRTAVYAKDQTTADDWREKEGLREELLRGSQPPEKGRLLHFPKTSEKTTVTDGG